MPNLGRAYSFLEIKSIEEDARIIRGVATTPTPDRAKDVVNPMGARFDLPIPHLWQHNHDQPIGHVIEATPKKSGIPFVSQIAKTDEPGPLKDLLDMAWQSMKMLLVRAVSIGFLPDWEKTTPLASGGYHFDEWSWYELSSVTIPMQPEATITTVKSIDRIYREVAGIPDLEYPDLNVVSMNGEPIARIAEGERLNLIPSPPEPAASGKKALPVVRLNDPAGVSAKPFVINQIKVIPR